VAVEFAWAELATFELGSISTSRAMSPIRILLMTLRMDETCGGCAGLRARRLDGDELSISCPRGSKVIIACRCRDQGTRKRRWAQ